MDVIKITQHMIGHHHTQMCLANKSEDKAHHANKALEWWNREQQLLQENSETSTN
jgi:hypothetical protein